MITIQFHGKLNPAFREQITKCGWEFRSNHRGITDRITTKEGRLVAFSNTNAHGVSLEFGFIEELRQFLTNLEVE